MSARDLVTREQLERVDVIEDLLDRYGATGDPMLADEALRLVEGTIPELEHAPELRGHYRYTEARAHWLRYEKTGDSDELRRSVLILDTALEELAPDSPGRLVLMTNLGTVLFLLYKLRGDLDDLRRALDIDERVLELTLPDAPDYWQAQRNVALDLVRVFIHTRDPLRLERAIGLLEEARAALAPGGREHASVQSDLANARFVRVQAYGSPIDTFMARRGLEQAIATTKFGSEQRSRYLGNLGWILLNAYASSPVPELADLDAAVRAFDNALAPTSAASPDRALRERNLAVALVRRFERTGDHEDLERALRLFRESATSRSGGAEVRLEAAIIWGRFAGKHAGPHEAADAWGAALEVMRELFALQVRRSDKEAWLWRVEGVPAEAALARARTGDPEGAAVAIDTGRALMLVEALALRSTEVGRLEREGHGDLRARYARAAERLTAARAAHQRDELPVGGPLSPLTIEGSSIVARRPL